MCEKCLQEVVKKKKRLDVGKDDTRQENREALIETVIFNFEINSVDSLINIKGIGLETRSFPRTLKQNIKQNSLQNQK